MLYAAWFILVHHVPCLHPGPNDIHENLGPKCGTAACTSTYNLPPY